MPSGDKLDYSECTKQITSIDSDMTVKSLHFLTCHGRKTKKNSKGNRVKYTGGNPIELYISSETSIKDNELTDT